MNHLTIAQIHQLIEYSIDAPDPPIKDYWEGLGNDAPYYKFLYYLAQITGPGLIVELGVLHGKGTVHLAAGAPGAKVIGVDINPPALDIQPLYPNLEWWQGNTLDLAERVAALNLSIDILFLDSTHESAHAMGEFHLYWPLIRPGGIFIADDIYLGDMVNFWHIVPEPKFVDHTLHGALGFGLALK